MAQTHTETSAKSEKEAVAATIASYFAALNGARITDMLPLYAEDAVVMPPGVPAAQGANAIRQEYESLFKNLAINTTYTVDELNQIAPAWAFVRASTVGTYTPTATGKADTAAFRELFILQKGPDAKWRIARYSISPGTPPRVK